jgi:hypothetical protein
MDRDNLGFDFDAVMAAIEDRFLSSGPCAVIGDRPEKHTVDALMDEHRLQHGIPGLFEKYGVWLPAPRCSVWPCSAAGLTFAALEMRGYQSNALAEEDAALFEAVAARRSLREELRQELDALATRRREALFSRPLLTRAPRRPPLGLAQAVAQHLRSGGLSYRAIGELMGSTAEAARKRCKARDLRTVIPYVESEHRGAA